MSQYFSFQWHITDECDQRCKHCYIFSGEGCRELKSMTWDQMQEVVANCEDFCRRYHRIPYFYITGGDPVIHPDFWKLMVLLKSKKIPFTLMGNPFHLDDEICKMLKVCGCEKYQMSLDGMRETHDWFRKPGSFDLTLEKVGCPFSALPPLNSYPTLVLKLFRGEPAISKFVWNFTASHTSSPVIATNVGSDLHGALPPLHPGHG